MRIATLRVLIVVALGLWGSPAGATKISWDFENGGWPGSGPLCCNAIPTIINATGGNPNHYARLTASPADCGSAFFTTCPRTRAESFIGQLPDVAGDTRTYSIDIRFPSGIQPMTGHDALIWQSFSNGSTSEHRTTWIGTQNGRIYIANPVTPVPNTQYTVNLGPIQGPGSTVQAVDLGPLVYDEWHTYRVVVVQAVTPNPGSVTVYKDNVLIGTMSGQPTLWSLAETEVFVNYVDGNGVLGVVDFDNASLATPPPAPTGLMVQ
jgi:hypothetical protein